MRRPVRICASLALVALLAACGSTVKLDEPPVESRTPTPVAPMASTVPPALNATEQPKASSAARPLMGSPIGVQLSTFLAYTRT